MNFLGQTVIKLQIFAVHFELEFHELQYLWTIFMYLISQFSYNFSLFSQAFIKCFFIHFFSILLKGVIEKVVRYHNGAWQKVNFVVLADNSLAKLENVFECVVKLPQTAYTVRRTMLYTPSKYTTLHRYALSKQQLCLFV